MPVNLNTIMEALSSEFKRFGTLFNQAMAYSPGQSTPIGASGNVLRTIEKTVVIGAIPAS